MVTWEEAIWTFKPWYVFDRLVSDKDPQHFCGRWPVMSAQRCVDSQSKLGIAKSFYPIICMQGWTDHGDSLAKSGQDWPDRLPIRPATLLIELNIVCFTLDLLVHWSAVTGTQSQCREAKEAGQWDELQCYSQTAGTFKKNRPHPMLAILILLAGWDLQQPIIATYQCTIHSVVLLSLANVKPKKGWRPCWAVSCYQRLSVCD